MTAATTSGPDGSPPHPPPTSTRLTPPARRAVAAACHDRQSGQSEREEPEEYFPLHRWILSLFSFSFLISLLTPLVVVDCWKGFNHFRIVPHHHLHRRCRHLFHPGGLGAIPPGLGRGLEPVAGLEHSEPGDRAAPTRSR